MALAGNLERGLVHHDELVRLARRRVEKAKARIEAARREDNEASAALTDVLAARAAWLAANPDDQMEMFDG